MLYLALLFFYFEKMRIPRIYRHTLWSIVLLLIVAACQDEKLLPEQMPVTFDSLTATDPTSVHVFVISDWGYSGSKNQLLVESAMNETAKRIRLDFMLTCGDNFQIAGVASATDSLWYYNFENVYKDSALLVPWYPALGNHDYYQNANAQVEYSAKSKYWKMPSNYYTFVKPIDGGASARFVVIDTQALISAYQALPDASKFDTIAQYVWLKEVLANKTEKWVIVTGHHTLFSASPHHGDTEELKTMLKPLLERYAIDFYICGHDHNFEHAKVQGAFPEFIVTGTCGTPREAGANERTIRSFSTLGFSYLALSRDSIQLNFINADGLVGYRFSKKK